MSIFQLSSKFKPQGDQPQAIKQLTKNLKAGLKDQVLLGVTGSGKTFTIANVIQNIQKPTLVISHNKTLAWQLYKELKALFPDNAVHYFVSYYDYYQPEAYLPASDTYIEKDAKINEEIDRLRHAATEAILTRPDTIVVASVSCIYNIGSPKEYQELSLPLKVSQKISRQEILHQLIELQYKRNDIASIHGTFQVKGDSIRIFAPTGEQETLIELWDNKIDRIAVRNTDSLDNKFNDQESFLIFPAKHFVTPQGKVKDAIKNIKKELRENLTILKKEKKLLEAQRLEQKTNFDMEMLLESGYCSGIENYSRHLSFKKPGESPCTLMDFFQSANGDEFLTIIDESHMSIPQVRGMFNGDQARKQTLINFGFRLPSALDNRPLKFDEFEGRIGQTIYVSATPGKYELENPTITEQLIRPTGLLDPTIEIHPTQDQIPHLIKEIEKRTKRNERVIITTVTKRLAENLSDFLNNKGIKVQYLHSEIHTMERPKILHDLRSGKYDVLVGINLLREGLDLPEVSLIAILDADKEGFLRNEPTLVQTMGRAARHSKGHVIMYADKITQSMKAAIHETERRRKIQENYNIKHNIKPTTIKKPLENILPSPQNKITSIELPNISQLTEPDLLDLIEKLTKDMWTASKDLDFEKAVELRDAIGKVKKHLRK